MATKTSTYLRFVELSRTVMNMIHTEHLDETARLLLDELAVRDGHGKPMTVAELMALQKIASPATLHKKFNLLLKAQMVDTIFEGDNRRTKYVTLLPKAKSFYTRLDGVLAKSI